MTRIAFALICFLAAPLGGLRAAEEPDYTSLRNDMVRIVEIGAAITGEDTGIKRLDSRAMTSHEVLHTDVPQPIRRPAEGLVVRGVEMHAPHQRVDRMVLYLTLNVLE